MALFGSARDASLVRSVNRELINDYIDTEVAFYKLSLEDTRANLYDEADNKVYFAPIRLNCIIEKGDTGTGSDFSNVPYQNVIYTNINDVGRQWIRRYTLALAKEMLGYIRGKYSSVPIPNADVTLNGSDLISAAQTEKEGLITELKEMLDTMSRQAQLERKQAEAEALQQQMNKIPLKIYIG